MFRAFSRCLRFAGTQSSGLVYATVCAGLLLAGLPGSAAVAAESLGDIVARFDVVNFTLEDKAQLQAFEELQAAAEAYTIANPDHAAGWAWRGIIDSSFAGAKGGMGALGLAKSSKKALEQSVAIDDSAVDGAAYTSLGALYFKGPGWPLGFGDNDKAAEYLQKGLDRNPDGIESNFFQAEFLVDRKKPDEALVYYRRALAAPDRPGREIADRERRKQIEGIIAELTAKQ